MPNRLGLARWLVDEENPLTARVAVNRAWEQLFGRGLVETSEDFGTQGAPPSHPELLDWLATEFVEQGWRTKALHKLIVTSATYRQSSCRAAGARGARSRTTACSRAVRASGWKRKWCATSCWPRADSSAGRSADRASSRRSRTASGTFPYSSEKWTPSDGEDRYRRGLYVFIRRSAAYPSFMTFDATSREHCTVRRVRTNTPLQALTTLNDEAFFEAARALAARVLRETPAVAPRRASRTRACARAAYAFRLVVTRTPKPDEVERIVASYTRQLERFRKEPERGRARDQRIRGRRRRSPPNRRRGRSSPTRS